jgi:hypothetical protein
MRRLLTTLIVPAGLLLTVLATVPASAEVWCLRTPDQSGGTCVFPSGHDCARAAAFGAFGGVCERQPLAERSRPRSKARIGQTAADLR